MQPLMSCSSYTPGHPGLGCFRSQLWIVLKPPEAVRFLPVTLDLCVAWRLLSQFSELMSLPLSHSERGEPEALSAEDTAVGRCTVVMTFRTAVILAAPSECLSSGLPDSLLSCLSLLASHTAVLLSSHMCNDILFR